MKLMRTILTSFDLNMMSYICRRMSLFQSGIKTVGFLVLPLQVSGQPAACKTVGNYENLFSTQGR